MEDKMAEDAQLILTRDGYERLKEELEHLRSIRRQEVAERLRLARETGEAGGAEYMAVQEEQAFLEGRIASLEKLMSEASIADTPDATNRPEVGLGCTAVVRDEEGEEERYLIVGAMEADPASGRISSQSPVGQALMAHRVGDTVEVETPMGTRRLTIVDIS
jgi:transcription elongation factor GreA